MGLRVRGYAAVFGNEDADGEVIVEGAFSNWIAANPNTRVKFYWVHSHKFDPLAKPIGATDLLRQDSQGLYFEGEVMDTPEGIELQTLLKGGAVRAASFAYKINDGFERDGVVYLTDLDLIEISAANWGVNNGAYIEAIPEQEEMSA